MIVKLAIGLTALCALLAQPALALSLGEAELRSGLNQRLEVRIPLAHDTDLDDLKVGLADAEAFQRAGLERSDLHAGLRFSVVATGNGGGYVRVTSKSTIREPFLTFVLEVDSPRGRLHREYALLFEAPGP